jgi:hypothetical protein
VTANDVKDNSQQHLIEPLNVLTKVDYYQNPYHLIQYSYALKNVHKADRDLVRPRSHVWQHHMYVRSV